MEHTEETVREAVLEARYAFMEALEKKLSRQFAEMLVGERIDSFSEALVSDYMRAKNAVRGGSIMNKPTAIVAAIGLALSLAACVSAEERAKAQESYEISECGNLGFKPDTEAFANCRLQVRSLQMQRASAAAAIVGATRTVPVRYGY